MSTSAEVLSLVDRAQRGEPGSMAKLWAAVERFVRWRAVRTLHSLPSSAGVTLDDLTQSGFFALDAAVRYYDADRPGGANFTDLLSRCLTGAFLEACGGAGDAQERDPLRQAGTASLSAPIGNGDGDGLTLEECIQNERDEISDAEQRIFAEQLHAELDAALDELPAADGAAIRWRYYGNMTAAEIAARAGTSPEATRQAEQRAYRAIRSNKRSAERLRGYLDAVTPFYSGTGLQAYKRTQTSPVERQAIYREELETLARGNVEATAGAE